MDYKLGAAYWKVAKIRSCTADDIWMNFLAGRGDAQGGNC